MSVGGPGDVRQTKTLRSQWPESESVSFTHFGFTSKKVALRDKEETPNDAAVAASTVGPLTTRTEDPLPPSDSPEQQRLVEAECSEDAAGAEITLAATAASTSDLPACWSTKQLGTWKDRNCL